MSTQNKRVTFPYAIKTIAISNVNTQPYVLLTPYPAQTFYACEMALEIFPPLYTYAPQGLFMHLKYTFDTSVAVGDRQITRVYVRDTPSSYVRNSSTSTIENYMDVNWVADVNRTIEVSMDLSSLLTGKATNVVFLRFPVGNYPQAGRGSDNITIWKLDLVYQTIGIRDEK